MDIKERFFTYIVKKIIKYNPFHPMANILS